MGEKLRLNRFAGGAQRCLLTDASSRTCRGSGVSAAPVPPRRRIRIPQVERAVNNIGMAKGST
jgi:hypothetical protein